MVLVLDVGNTNIVVGCIDRSENIKFVARIDTDINKSEAQYTSILKDLFKLNHIERQDIEGSIISSVVPPITNTIKNAVENIMCLPPIIINNNLTLNFNIDIDSPAQLGSDLLVAAVAAVEKYPLPLIIFDLGTATTVSVIDRNKNFIGGIIMPGVKISLNALSNLASQLPNIAIENPKQVIGKNTIDSMKSGIIHGTAAMIDGIIDRIENELNIKAKVVVTGGLSTYITPFCKRDTVLDEHLILRGLLHIYIMNKS